MKRCLVFAVLAFLIASSSCNKSNVHPTNGNNALLSAFKQRIAGQWQLVSDSTSDSMLRTSALTTMYKGQAGDYFDFRDNGYCYTKEGAVYDTLSYRLTGYSGIMLQKFGLILNGIPETSTTSFTGSSLTITTNNIFTPAGTLYRKVILTR